MGIFRTILIAVFILGPVFHANGQENRIFAGVRYGVPDQEWRYEGTIKALQSRSSPCYVTELSIRYEWKNNGYIGLGVGIYHFRDQLFLAAPTVSAISVGRVRPTVSHQLVPYYRKDFNIVHTKFGAALALGIPVFFSGTIPGQFPENELNRPTWPQWMAQRKTIYIEGNVEVKRPVSWLLRPEVGVYYNLFKRIRLTADAVWAINPGKPIVVKQLDRVEIDEVIYHSTHRLKGDYFVLLLGLEYLIK